MRTAFPFLLACLLAPAASADPVPMSAGGQPAPRESSQIAIAREILTIDVSADRARVLAVLQLENRGAATALTVGFPCAPRVRDDVAGLDCRTRLDVRVRGRKVALRRARTSRAEHHWLWKMRLAEGEAVEVRVAYTTRLQNERYQVPLAGLGTLTYRLTTGAAWAGPIGELEMKVRLPVENLVHVAPAGYVRAPGELTWRLADHEPTEDLAITLDPITTGDELRKDHARTLERFRARRDDVWTGLLSFHDMARRTFGLRAPTREEFDRCVEESVRILGQAAGAR